MPAPNVAEGRADRGERSVFVFSRGSAAPMVIAGATIVRTNADLRETFGVKSGVLVLDVARGSPAYSVGPQGRRHHRVRWPNRRDVAAVGPAGDRERRMARSFRFAIIRKKKEQSLTLRW